MPHTAPINTSKLKKEGIIDEEKFFSLLSAENNYIDLKNTKTFYMGLVRVMTKELKEKGIVRLPHIGDFALVKQKDRYGLKGKTMGMITGVYVVKFYIKRAWRDYFKKLEEKSGLQGALDPREKSLGYELE